MVECYLGLLHPAANLVEEVLQENNRVIGRGRLRVCGLRHGDDRGNPAIAEAARIQGTVIIEATIGTDGTVINARVVRALPMLDEAALQAVRQWRYTPTKLNGKPVEVRMMVSVTFTGR